MPFFFPVSLHHPSHGVPKHGAKAPAKPAAGGQRLRSEPGAAGGQQPDGGEPQGAPPQAQGAEGLGESGSRGVGESGSRGEGGFSWGGGVDSGFRGLGVFFVRVFFFVFFLVAF